jgi:hypothetical protein
VLFTPRIRDGAMVGSGIRDKQTKFVNSLYIKIGRIQDPGSEAFLPRGSGIQIRDGTMVGSGSGIKHHQIRHTGGFERLFPDSILTFFPLIRIWILKTNNLKWSKKWLSFLSYVFPHL